MNMFWGMKKLWIFLGSLQNCTGGSLLYILGLFLKVGMIVLGSLKFGIIFWVCLNSWFFFLVNSRCWVQTHVSRKIESTRPGSSIGCCASSNICFKWQLLYQWANLTKLHRNVPWLTVYKSIAKTNLGSAVAYSGRVLDPRPRGRGCEPHQHHCVVSLSKNINPSLVLVQPRKTHPFKTERLLMGGKESNQTKGVWIKRHKMVIRWPRLVPVLKTIFHQCVISYTCSQSNSDGFVLRQSHQS